MKTTMQKDTQYLTSREHITSPSTCADQSPFRRSPRPLLHKTWARARCFDWHSARLKSSLLMRSAEIGVYSGLIWMLDQYIHLVLELNQLTVSQTNWNKPGSFGKLVSWNRPLIWNQRLFWADFDTWWSGINIIAINAQFDRIISPCSRITDMFIRNTGV